MGIEKLEKIKEDFTIKYNVIRNKEFLVEIDEGYDLIRQFMSNTIVILKNQSNQIDNLRKKLIHKS